MNERRLLERIKRGIAGEKNERKLKEKKMKWDSRRKKEKGDCRRGE